ncbi:glutaredoxin domain-containing protein [Massilibacteroides sp.]|uniref:thioredoxin family protein n=1 Tax=Massilibacteroides sp. TaxID=2034766 RepID=UPI00261B80B7|nr:glutaredoxin domain-containing protein [Massilibacteroides sp.]MDD4514694.1 glutaredoxin domain-containing protein [Massilibacteroides sp.]
MKKIVKFEKRDCNPCVMVSNFLDTNGVDYQKVNPFDEPHLAMKYKVRTVPTVILLDEEQEVYRTIGFQPNELKELISFTNN